jgi:hypothetical protein
VLDVEVRDVGLVWKSERQQRMSCSRTAQQLGDGVGVRADLRPPDAGGGVDGVRLGA